MLKRKFISAIAAVMAMTMIVGSTVFAAASPKAPQAAANVGPVDTRSDYDIAVEAYNKAYWEGVAALKNQKTAEDPTKLMISAVIGTAAGTIQDTMAEVTLTTGTRIAQASLADMHALKAAYEAAFPGEEYYTSVIVLKPTTMTIKVNKAVAGKVKINYVANGVFGTVPASQITVGADGSLTFPAQPGVAYSIIFVK